MIIANEIADIPREKRLGKDRGVIWVGGWSGRGGWDGDRALYGTALRPIYAGLQVDKRWGRRLREPLR